MKVGDLVRITNEKGSWKRPRVSLALVRLEGRALVVQGSS